MICSLGIFNFPEEIFFFLLRIEKRSSVCLFYCFLLFLCTVQLRLSYLSLLFFGTLHSDGYIFLFLLGLSFAFFSLLFVRPPQTIILPFLHFFSLGWVWSPLPVQCYEPPAIFFRHCIRSNPLNLFLTSTV